MGSVLPPCVYVGRSNHIKMGHPEEVESPASWFVATRSIQLSYGCIGPRDWIRTSGPLLPRQVRCPGCATHG